jgi:hypothetical protein
MVLPLFLAMPLPSLACEARTPLFEPLGEVMADDEAHLSTGKQRFAIASLRWVGEAGLERQALLAPLRERPAGAVTEAAILGPPDRWGREQAAIILRDGEKALLSLPEDAVKAGLALAWPDPDAEDPCFSALLALEGHARRSRAGLWGKTGAITMIDDSSNPPGREAIGRPALARGRIDTVVLRPSLVYLNFGAAWRQRLSVVLALPKAKERREALIKTVTALAGKRVLLRGILEAGKDAPRLRITDSRQIAIDEAQDP